MKTSIQKIAEGYGLKTMSYSGRGMYRKTCLGIVGSLNDILEIYYDLGSNDREFVSGIRTDSFGKDQIFYFPSESYYEDNE